MSDAKNFLKPTKKTSDSVGNTNNYFDFAVKLINICN